eukprot:9150359-Alexandrium_andersonii.AAC.1
MAEEGVSEGWLKSHSCLSGWTGLGIDVKKDATNQNVMTPSGFICWMIWALRVKSGKGLLHFGT